MVGGHEVGCFRKCGEGDGWQGTISHFILRSGKVKIKTEAIIYPQFAELNTQELLTKYWETRGTKKASPLGELLNCLSERDAIEMGLKYLYMYLPRFEFYHPQDKWVRRVFKKITAGHDIDWSDPLLEGIDTRWDRNYKPPGANAFIAGVYDLLDVIEFPDGRLCRSGAIASPIHAIIEETWARQYPFRWMTYQHFKYHQDTIAKEMDMSIISWMHKVHLYEPIIIELEQKLWTDVGHELEKRLRAQDEVVAK